MHGGAFTAGEIEVSESVERESKVRSRDFERPLRLGKQEEPWDDD